MLRPGDRLRRAVKADVLAHRGDCTGWIGCQKQALAYNCPLRRRQEELPLLHGLGLIGAR
jgi:hypothetical protein